MRTAHCAHFQGLAEDEKIFTKAHCAAHCAHSALAQRTVPERKHNTQRNAQHNAHGHPNA